MNEPRTPPQHRAWEERPAFRELFLVHFPPMAAEGLREAGRLFYEAALETGLPERPEPWLRTRVRALAEDLRFAGQVLATLGDERVEASLSREEIALSVRAEEWAEKVAGVVRAIDEALHEDEESR